MDPFTYYQQAKRNGFQSLPGKQQLAAVEAYGNGAALGESNTFTHIINFLEGHNPPRLPVAAADYCVTLETLSDWRDARMAPQTVAVMIVDRIKNRQNK
jgi:hypothetical protein